MFTSLPTFSTGIWLGILKDTQKSAKSVLIKLRNPLKLGSGQRCLCALGLQLSISFGKPCGWYLGFTQHSLPLRQKT